MQSDTKLCPQWTPRRERRSEIVVLSLSCYVILANSFPSLDGSRLKRGHRTRRTHPQTAFFGQFHFRIAAIQQEQ